MHNGLIYLKNKLITFSSLLFLNNYAVGQISCERVLTKEVIKKTLSKGKDAKLPLGSILTRCNYNDSIKNLLLMAANQKWNYNQIDSFIESSFKKNEFHYYLDDRARVGKPASYLQYFKIKDSIINIEKKKIYDENREFFKVDRGIILNIGFLQINEAVANLKSYLNESEYYDNFAVKISLARLKDKKSEAEILKGLEDISNLDDWEWVDKCYNNLAILSFIGSNESIEKFSSFLDTTKHYEYSSNGAITLSGNIVLQYLNEYLVNPDLKMLLKNTRWSREENSEERKRLIMEVKKWLIDNKNKYQINEFFIPNL